MIDPYLYPKTDVLKNKFGIKDEKVLLEMEAEYTSLRLREVTEKPLKGDYDFKHFCDIHRFIFQDLYEWAGQPRIMNFEKPEMALGGISIEYKDFAGIKELATLTISKIKAVSWDSLSLDDKAQSL